MMEKQTAQLRGSRAQERPPLTSVSEEHSSDSSRTLSEEQLEHSSDTNHTLSEEQLEHSSDTNHTLSEEQLEHSADTNHTLSEEQLDRPYSPLPPLTIEIVPKLNKHDEPEEYYTRLEKKMMKLYRRSIIEDRSNISNMSDSTNNTDISITRSKYSKKRASFCVHNIIDVDENIMTETDVIDIGAATQTIDSQKDDSESAEVEPSEVNSAEVESAEIESAEVEPAEIESDGIESAEVESAEVESVDERNIATEYHKDVENNSGSVDLEENDVPVIDIPEEGESQNIEVAMSPRVFISARRSLDTPPPVIASVSDIIDNQNKSNEVTESQNIEAARSSGMSAGRASDKSANTDIDNSKSTETVKSHEIEVQESSIICVTTERASDKSVTATVLDNTDYHIELAEDVESQNIKVMRSPREGVSAGSIQNEPDDVSPQNITEVREREEARIESASTEESIRNIVDCGEPTDSDVILRSPILGQKNTYENVAREKLRKRSRSPSPSQNKRGRYSDVGVQTDFDDVNRRILSEGIFMGTPRVFSLDPSRMRQLFESYLPQHSP